MIDVSVVIPTRDRPALLALTLRSVLWQEHVQFEVLVVDDGEERDTEVLLKAFANTWVHYLRNTGPAGVSSARNCGIAAARGEWIAFLDDDDLWAPDKLVTQLALAKKTGAGWVYAGDVTVDEALQVHDGAPPLSPEDVVTELRRYNAVPAGASNVVVRRHVLDTVGGFDPELRTSEDWDLWLRLASTGLPACVPRPLVALRSHAGMASRNVDAMLADIEMIARRHGISVDRARHRRWAAWMALQSGRRGSALRHYGRAVLAGDLASIGRAAAALAYPGVARDRVRATDSWTREAQAWLNALRAASATGAKQTQRTEHVVKDDSGAER